MPTPPEIVPADPAQTAEIRKLLDRAQQGDTSVLEQMREILDTNPQVWHIAGDLAFRVENTLIELFAGGDLLTRESIKRQLNEMKSELAGPSPSPLEKLLVDRVSLDWLFLSIADLATLRTTPADDFIPLGAKFKEDKREFAHRRFLRSIKVLADVRRLLKPKAAPLDFTRFAEGGRAAPQSLPWPGPARRRPAQTTAIAN